jgi:hypothetical protein
MSGPRSGLDEGSRLSQYTLVPAATVKEFGTNVLPWIKTKAWTLIRLKGCENTLEPAVALMLTVELTTAAPLAALRVIVTELESWPGKLTELGLNVAVTPLGRGDAVRV